MIGNCDCIYNQRAMRLLHLFILYFEFNDTINYRNNMVQSFGMKLRIETWPRATNAFNLKGLAKYILLPQQ